jgi:hypothetical protein
MLTSHLSRAKKDDPFSPLVERLVRTGLDFLVSGVLPPGFFSLNNTRSSGYSDFLFNPHMGVLVFITNKGTMHREYYYHLSGG